MHHVYDETPNDPVAVPDYLPTSTISHAIYNTHVGRVDPAAAANDREQIDTSQYRYSRCTVPYRTVPLKLPLFLPFLTLMLFWSLLHRRRGYKIGSLMTGPDEEDHYYKQPGHPLSKDSEKGRFK